MTNNTKTNKQIYKCFIKINYFISEQQMNLEALGLMNVNYLEILLSNIPLGPRIKFENYVKMYQESLVKNLDHVTANKSIISNIDEISQKFKVTTENKVFQLNTILTSYAQGSFDLDYFKKYKILNESFRNVLVEIILNDLVKRKSQMTFRLANSVGNTITGTFPTEIKVGSLY